MMPFCISASSNPSSARRIAGAATSIQLMVPYFCRAVHMPRVWPGTPTAVPPSLEALLALASSEAYISLVAELGATSR